MKSSDLSAESNAPSTASRGWLDTQQFSRDDQIDYPVARLEDLFTRQVQLHPDDIAIAAPSGDRSYQAVDKSANAIARAAADSGIESGSIIATLIDDGVLQVEALLGALKTGCAFVCLDPCHPAERLAEIVSEVKPVLLITDRAGLRHDQILTLAHDCGASLLCLDDSQVVFGGAQLLFDPTDNNEVSDSGSVGDTAYLVYTSGSTGRPKGIVQTHRSFTQFLHWQAREIGIERGQRFAQWASIGYDASYCEIFGTLCFGATLCIESADVRFNPPRLVEWLNRTGATILQIVPSFCRQVVEVLPDTHALPALQHLMLAGEALPADLARKWLERVDSSIRNLYGPSECVLATSYKIDAVDPSWTHIPIGGAIDGRQILVLNDEQALCLTGNSGEIYIRSQYLTSGYLNREEEDSARFIQNPLHDEFNDPVFRTGDMARVTETGSIDFIGRVDRMVKLRGMRVELGEIEFAISEFSGIVENVCQVCVLQRHQDRLTAKDRAARDISVTGSQFLVAYYTTTSRVSLSKLREHLRGRLPVHMVPQQFIELAEMPRNANNKLDLNSLPDPANVRPELEVMFREACNDAEKMLALIWSEVLGIDRIGMDDGFLDLGGDSLLGMQVINRAAERGFFLRTRNLLQNGSIAELLSNDQTRSSPATSTPTKVELEHYPLTHAQWGLWYLWRIDPTNPHYTAQGSIHLRGHLDVEAWANAWVTLVDRHQALRASFTMVAGEARQTFSDRRAASIETKDLSHLDAATALAEMDRINTELGRHAFDLENDQLLRPILFKLAEDHHEFVLTYQEIIFDLWAYATMIRDLTKLYLKPGSLEPLEIDLGDMAVWEAKERTREILTEQDTFWRAELEGQLPIMNLPLDRPRQPLPDYSGGGATTLLTPELTAQVKRLAANYGASIFTTLLTAFNLLLRTYSGQDDAVIGVTVANRAGRAAEDMVGWFVNMVPVRLQVQSHQSFGELIELAKEKATDCIANSNFPFHWMLEHADVRRDMSVTPVFQVMFNWQNLPQQSLQVDDLDITSSEVDSTYKKYDLALYAQEHLDRIYLQISYLSELFDHETIERMLANLVLLLENVCDSPDKPVSQLEKVCSGELQKLIGEFSGPENELSADFSLPAAFELQVKATPDADALVFGESRLSYTRLDERANAIAAALAGSGVTTGKIVALCLDRGFDTVAAVIAVAKINATHVAIDTSHPELHRKRILADTGAHTYLHHSAFAPPASFPGEALSIDDVGKVAADIQFPGTPTDPNAVYNIVYTSGSTGEPKSVAIANRALQNRLEWMWNTYPWQNGDVAVLQKSYAIVAASWELWGGLLRGVPTVILDQEVLHDPPRFWDTCVRHGVTHLLSSPSLITSLLGHAERRSALWPTLRFATTSAEPISPALVQRWKNNFPNVPLINLYGSTECASNVTYFDTSSIEENSWRVPIGRPLTNTAVYVLDADQNIAPHGATGEMCVTGYCLALGYHGGADTDRERFVQNSFDNRSEYFYRTGDMVRINNGLNIELLGREDQQVAIRGFRVELGAIEACILAYTAIDKCVARIWDSEGGPRLCAYFSPGSDDQISVAELRKHLRDRLPDFMVPQHLIELEVLPTTANGKIDLAALALPSELQPKTRVGNPPQTDAEITIANIWKQILGIDVVLKNDYFFDLGGHSLLAINSAALIEEQLGVDIPFRTIVFSDLETIARVCSETQRKSVLGHMRRWLGQFARPGKR